MTDRSSLPGLPSSPVDLVAVAVGGLQVILAWTECGAGGLGFRVERSDGYSPGGKFRQIGRVGPHIAAFCDGTVDARTTYRYRVLAWNGAGDSSPSGVVEVTTPRGETEPPSDKD